MAGKLENALRRGSYTSAVGHELHKVTAAAMEQTGWLAYDAGWGERARHWWLEACHLADLANVPEARVTALASMSLQVSTDLSRGRETVALAQAARTAAGKHATPGLLSLLAAREAVGHAHNRDRAAAAAAISDARRSLDQRKHSEEPLLWGAWLDFWGPADLACHENRVSLALGNGTAAEEAARAAFSSVDAATYPRNYTIYAVRLGSTLVQRGQLDEAIAVTSEAVQHVAAVRGSRRIISDLHNTVNLLDRQNYAPATNFASTARQLLPAA